MNAFLIVVAVLIAIPFLFSVLIFIVVLLEKIDMRDFGPTTISSEEHSAYSKAMNQSAQNQGLIKAGEYRQIRGGIYKVYIIVWFTPCQKIIVVVGGGSIAKIPYRATRVYSRLSDGKLVLTTDEPGLVDLSDLIHHNLVLNGDLQELMDSHTGKLKELGIETLPFDTTDGLRAYKELQYLRTEKMEQLGLIRFINLERSAYRHTLSGAVKNYRQSEKLKLVALAQKERIHKKRPGE